MTTVSKRPLSTPRELTRVGDRLSFVYLERCVVHREANAITAEDGQGTTHIPSATIGTLLLGPGTRVTHQAMSVLGESGAGVVWVGEHGVRFYAGGRALTRSSALVEAQATQWANRRTRLEVARAVVAGLGCSPGLGFIHSGHELSFVLDIADLYKTEVGIPVAFDVAAEGGEEVGARTRRAIRDKVNDRRLLERCVDDIKRLLLSEAVGSEAEGTLEDRVTLQSDRGRDVEAGRNYADGVIW
ncbi:CRISPR-associated endonuclease Cas1 [Streptomyces syringium]|uniref:CRISPR-associated endonuclease Cas1 n=1 Tax=Streptomyces syringium TaxID=76729 RepID=UPI0033E8C6C4